MFKLKNNSETILNTSGKVSPTDSNNKILLKIPKVKSKRITLNASGFEYKIPLDQFDRMPESRLGKLRTLIENPKNATFTETMDDLCERYDLKTNTFYFDKDPFILNTILNYFNNGSLHVEEMMCGFSLSEDFEYWQIGDEHLDSCCREKFHQDMDDVNEKLNDEEKIIKKYESSKNFGKKFYPKIRAKGYEILNTKVTWLARVRQFLNYCQFYLNIIFCHFKRRFLCFHFLSGLY